jgi:predicted nucleic-acid-binding protein
MNAGTSQILGSLGILTKSHSAIDQNRLSDYLLQDQASKLLQHKFRVKYCLKRKINKSELVNVCWNESTKKAHFGNVIRCGSVWVCPVCAKKITEKRRTELSLINERWKKGITLYSPVAQDKNFIGAPVFIPEIVQGYTYLITLTNPHYAQDRLSDLREKQKEAMKKFFSDRKGRYIFDHLMGKRFHVTNYEVTYGQNGWHPHHHILVFSDKYLSIHEFNELHEIMADHWRSSLAAVGIRKVKEHEKFIACDFQDGTYADQYVGKWGIEHEMTKGHVKKGKETFTPFDLLRLSEKDDLIFEKFPSKLFQEFAIAFKGARQLVFSRGLKHSFAIKDISDDQIADSVLDEAQFLTNVEDMAFHLLCKYKKRAQFLDCITQDKINAVLGNGSAELLISSLAQYEISILEEINSIEVSIPKFVDEIPPVLLDSFTLT